MTRNPFRALVMAAIVGAVAVSFACGGNNPWTEPSPQPGQQQAAPGQYMLAGAVVDDEGMPLAGVEIEATSGAGVSNTITASDGTFSLLVAGEVTLRAHRPGYKRAELTLHVLNDTTLGISLTRQRVDPDAR